MNFLYVGRLDKEKGIISLIECINKISISPQNIHIHVFGKGYYMEDIQKLSKNYPNIITYHGRKDKKEIIGIRRNADFLIMPSTFLETFGLTACESLLCGVPVIANKKGGLLPFIDDELNIQNYPGSTDGDKLYNLIKHITESKRSKKDYQKVISHAQKTYTKEKRIKKISTIIGEKKNIMMISDFINYNGGGIETHIHDVVDILRHDHNIILYGHQAPTGKWSSLRKIAIMFLSFINIQDSYHIIKNIKEESIGLVRRHSVSRAIGWMPLRFCSPKQSCIMTHHELGLFHPFPSQVTQLEQIPKARSISSFINASQTNNVLKKIATAGKYGLIWCIHKQLQKKIKTHIVPSERMIDIVRKWHPTANIVCIPHFVDI